MAIAGNAIRCLLPKLGRNLGTNIAENSRMFETVLAREKNLQRKEFGQLFEDFGEIPAIRTNAQKIAGLNNYSQNVLLNIPSTQLRETLTTLTTTGSEAARKGWDYLDRIDRLLENASLLDVKKDKKVIDELTKMCKTLETKLNKLKNGEFVDSFALENELARAESLALIPATSRGEVMNITGRVREALKGDRLLRGPSKRKDLEESMKQEQLVSYLGEEYKPNPCHASGASSKDFEDFLYNEYYLNRHPFGYGSRDALEAINKYYGTKTFVPRNAKAEDVDDILREFHAWNKAGGSKVNYERTLTFDDFDPFYQRKNAAGYASDKNFIRIQSNYFKIQEREWYPVLRHEKMHRNGASGKPFEKFGKNGEYDFSEKGKILTEKSWYRDEFRRAGISEGHIDYAYTNRDEFLAVAAEGNVTKYSDEFKKVLVELGIPEWFFNIRKFKSYNA